MFSTTLHPIFCLLIGVSLAISIWLCYFLHSLRTRYSRFDPRIRTPYLLYSTFILLWVMSNAFFYSPLITHVDGNFVVYMAQLSNAMSFLSFVCACSVTRILILDIETKTARYTQLTLLIGMTIWAMYLSLTPNHTVTNVTVYDVGKFSIHLGPNAKWLYLTAVTMVGATFYNIFLYTRQARPLRQVKSLYVLTGICIFMISTVIFSATIPLLWNEYSMTWIPPTLAISELLVVGYALLTTRFFSNRHVVYAITAFTLACSIIIFPLLALFYSLDSQNIALIVLISCLATGIIWRPLLRATKRFCSQLVFGNPLSPSKRIRSLGQEFQRSSNNALVEIANILNIDSQDLHLVSNLQDEKLYISQLFEHNNVIIRQEIENIILSDRDVNNMHRAIYAKMQSEAVSLVLPIFDYNQKLSHLLLAKNKANGLMYFYEEIKALQHVILVAQGYINADRKVHQAQALANSIAHEMRNPLAQALFQFELLDNQVQQRAPTCELELTLNKGKKAVIRGRQLIDIILREVNEAALEQVPTSDISIQYAVTQAVDGYAYDSEHIRQRIQINIDSNFTARVNETLFNFVIFNLLRNSIYYFDSHPDSKIEITTRTDKYEHFLIVRDSGPGIPCSLVKRVFDDFFSYNKPSGSGLGLGYCRRVMKSFGGSIQCYSKLGEYTEFHLSFPAGIEPMIPLTTSIQHSLDNIEIETSHQNLNNHFDGTSKTIMVVDDKAVQRELIKLYLDQLGYQVILASNGKISVELVQQNEVDFVLMDVQMPVMDGVEAAKQIRAAQPNLPIYALSGESGALELERIRQTMDGRLAKPTTKQILQQTLARVFAEQEVQLDIAPIGKQIEYS